MRRRHNHQRYPFRNRRRTDHTHWLGYKGKFWDGFQFLDPQQHAWQTYARTYTLTGARIALKALQKHYPDIQLYALDPTGS